MLTHFFTKNWKHSLALESFSCNWYFALRLGEDENPCAKSNSAVNHQEEPEEKEDAWRSYATPALIFKQEQDKDLEGQQENTSSIIEAVIPTKKIEGNQAGNLHSRTYL